MKKKTWIILGCVVLGILCIMIAFVYWTTPASLLPSFLPGREPGVIAVHVKHGIAAFVVGLGFFVLAWFTSGRKKSEMQESSREDNHS